MSQPEHEAIVDEIRSARIEASPELRARIRELAATAPPAPPRREFRWRRPVLVLVPVAVAVALTGALVAGLTDSGGGKTAAGHRQVAHGAVAPAPPPTVFKAAAPEDSATLTPRGAGSGAAGNLPAT